MSAIQGRRAGFGHAGPLPLFAQRPEGTSLGNQPASATRLRLVRVSTLARCECTAPLQQSTAHIDGGKVHPPWFRSVAASFQAFVAKWMLWESCTCSAATARLHCFCQLQGSHASDGFVPCHTPQEFRGSLSRGRSA